MLLPLLGACGTRSLSVALLVGMSFPKLQLLTLSPDCNTTAPPKPGESSVRAVEMLSWLLHNELFHGGFLGKRGLGRAVRPSLQLCLRQESLKSLWAVLRKCTRVSEV